MRISVDRTNAGEKDEVCLDIAWSEDFSEKVVFKNCYAAHLYMNFGVICEEQILNAYVDEKDAELHNIRKKWADVAVNLDALQCFRIETSSTASVMRIYAKDFETRR